MKYSVYRFIYQSSDARKFEFKSVGPKGEIDILVQFSETHDPNLINLSFGNKLPNGDLGHSTINGNLDRNIILATVAAAVFEFSAVYPEKIIIFTGSTPARTRLYRMAISINFDELSASFDIYGLQLFDFRLCLEQFVKEKSYIGFGVKRKTSKLHLWKSQ